MEQSQNDEESDTNVRWKWGEESILDMESRQWCEILSLMLAWSSWPSP